MEICLLSPAPAPGLRIGRPVRELATVLGRRHAVTVVHLGGVPPGPAPGGVREVAVEADEASRRTWFSCPEHKAAALALDAIRTAYPERGPDYLEAPDLGAPALVALQARATADPLFAGTVFALRAGPSAELQRLHDQALRESPAELVADLEREALREADLLLAADAETLAVYERYYAVTPPRGGLAVELPPRTVAAAPLELPAAPDSLLPAPAAGEPLRLLCLGQLSRAGARLDLVEALLGAAADGWELTLAGADTETATMRQSVREVAEAIAGCDPRLTFEEAPGPTRLAELLASRHVLLAPDHLCADPAPVLAALAAGMPVLAAPVGELAELVAPGVDGWLCEGLDPESLRVALERLLADPAAALGALAPAPERAARARARVDPEAVLAAYDELLTAPLRHRPAAAGFDQPPLVSGVVPYFGAAAHVERAVASLLAQTHPNLEVVVVNDGSFAPEDEVLGRFAAESRVRVITKVNGGETTARNLGALLARGEFVVLLDADNELEPGFVSRALAAHARDPELAYVACWLRMIGSDGEPLEWPLGSAQLGNRALAEEEWNFDGDTLALLPRSLFLAGHGFEREGSMHSDWEFYRRLRAEGRFGAVIPERLGRYRVLPESLMRGYGPDLQRRSWAEARDRIELNRTRWTAAGNA